MILLGDFNDGPEAATTQILYGAPGSQPRGPEDATNVAGEGDPWAGKGNPF